MSVVKLKQRLGTTLRALSLLLCGAFLLLGVRSCSTTDLVKLTTSERHYEMVTIPWSVRVTVARAWDRPHGVTWTAVEHPQQLQADYFPVFGQRPIYRTWYYFGMGIKKDFMAIPILGGGRRTVTYTILTIPFQTLAFIAFLPVTWRILTRRRRRKIREFRMEHGQCSNCGYDMRFSSDRCPECGEIVMKRAEQQRAEA